MKIQLTVKHGILCTPIDSADPELREFALGDYMLGFRDEEDEVKTARWPAPDSKTLLRALHDARETGFLPSGTESVILPDGTEFCIGGDR